MVCVVHSLKTSKKFVNILEDDIRGGGSVNKLVSDSAQAKASDKVQEIWCTLFIDS